MVTMKEALHTAQIKAAASDAIFARCSGVNATALPDASFLSAAAQILWNLSMEQERRTGLRGSVEAKVN